MANTGTSRTVSFPTDAPSDRPPRSTATGRTTTTTAATATSTTWTKLHTLTRASGSATHAAPSGHTIVCGVNFPVEPAPPRNLIPAACYVDVHVRPHDHGGGGGVRERHLETRVAEMLRAVVRVHDFPRMMLQVSLQVLGVPGDEERGGGDQAQEGLGLLAALVNAAVAGCLDAGVPMREVAGAVEVAAVLLPPKSGRQRRRRRLVVVVNPGVGEAKWARSRHVLAFTGRGELVLVESEGRFTMEEFEEVERVGRAAWMKEEAHAERAAGDVAVGNAGGADGPDTAETGKRTTVQAMMRDAVKARVTADERWREG